MLSGNDAGQSSQSPVRAPSCQVAGCFEPASVYVVIKETDINALGAESRLKLIATSADNSAGDINAFKLILYLCSRHDYDLKYLLKENELEIARRRHLVLKETG
ncbi:MAG: hypothetical protein MN733_05885 [Nitrososphaera sp.]|nr:hypothetical protein [Nitrososphaera sp.]